MKKDRLRQAGRSRSFFANELFFFLLGGGQLARAVRATSGLIVDNAEAVGALARLFFRRILDFCELLRAGLQRADAFDQKEDAKRDDEEIDERGEKTAEIQVIVAVQMDFADNAAKVAAAEDADDRQKDVVDQRVDDAGERGADDHADGKVDDIALQGKIFKFDKQRFELFEHGEILLAIGWFYRPHYGIFAAGNQKMTKSRRKKGAV